MKLSLLTLIPAALLAAAGCVGAPPAAPQAPEDALAATRDRFAELDGRRVRYKSLVSRS